MTSAGFNRRMRKTACPVVWKGHGAKSPCPHPIHARRRVPEQDDTMLDAIAEELSPNAVAIIAAGVAAIVGVFHHHSADTQARWFAVRLIERLGGKQACAQLLEELDA